MQTMLKAAIEVHPESFADFDVTKNVQDQLQEMVICGNNFEWTLRTFKTWHSKEIWGTGHPFTSMEQLWLLFVMKEKFNTVWDGDAWI